MRITRLCLCRPGWDASSGRPGQRVHVLPRGDSDTRGEIHRAVSGLPRDLGLFTPPGRDPRPPPPSLSGVLCPPPPCSLGGARGARGLVEPLEDPCSTATLGTAPPETTSLRSPLPRLAPPRPSVHTHLSVTSGRCRLPPGHGLGLPCPPSLPLRPPSPIRGPRSGRFGAHTVANQPDVSPLRSQARHRRRCARHI